MHRRSFRALIVLSLVFSGCSATVSNLSGKARSDASEPTEDSDVQQESQSTADAATEHSVAFVKEATAPQNSELKNTTSTPDAQSSSVANPSVPPPTEAAALGQSHRDPNQAFLTHSGIAPLEPSSKISQFAEFIYPINLENLGRPAEEEHWKKSRTEWNSKVFTILLEPIRQFRRRNNAFYGFKQDWITEPVQTCDPIWDHSALNQMLCGLPNVSIANKLSIRKAYPTSNGAGKSFASNFDWTSAENLSARFWHMREVITPPDMLPQVGTLAIAPGIGAELRLNYGGIDRVSSLFVQPSDGDGRTLIRNKPARDSAKNCAIPNQINDCHLVEMRSFIGSGNAYDSSFHFFARGNFMGTTAIQGIFSLQRSGKSIYSATDDGLQIADVPLDSSSPVYLRELVGDSHSFLARYIEQNGRRMIRLKFLGGNTSALSDAARLVRKSLEKGVCESGAGLQSGYFTCETNLLDDLFWLDDTKLSLPTSKAKVAEDDSGLYLAPDALGTSSSLRPEYRNAWFQVVSGQTELTKPANGAFTIPKVAGKTSVIANLATASVTKAQFKVKRNLSSGWFGMHFSKPNPTAPFWQTGAGLLLYINNTGAVRLEELVDQATATRKTLASSRLAANAEELTIELVVDGNNNTVSLKANNRLILQKTDPKISGGAFSFETFDAGAQISELSFTQTERLEP